MAFLGRTCWILSLSIKIGKLLLWVLYKTKWHLLHEERFTVQLLYFDLIIYWYTNFKINYCSIQNINKNEVPCAWHASPLTIMGLISLNWNYRVYIFHILLLHDTIWGIRNRFRGSWTPAIKRGHKVFFSKNKSKNKSKREIFLKIYRWLFHYKLSPLKILYYLYSISYHHQTITWS